MVGYGAIEYPLSTFTYVVAKVGTNWSFTQSKSFVITMLAITRTLLLIIEPYMYFIFLRLLVFFFTQHINATFKTPNRTKALSNQICLLKTWILSLTIMKMIHSLCIVTLNSLFQLVDGESYPGLSLAFLIIQRIYVPLVDFLITLSIMYLFYR